MVTCRRASEGTVAWSFLHSALARCSTVVARTESGQQRWLRDGSTHRWPLELPTGAPPELLLVEEGNGSRGAASPGKQRPLVALWCGSTPKCTMGAPLAPPVVPSGLVGFGCSAPEWVLTCGHTHTQRGDLRRSRGHGCLPTPSYSKDLMGAPWRATLLQDPRMFVVMFYLASKLLHGLP